MKTPKRKRDLTATEIADLRKRGLHDEARRELERQAKRFFSQPETAEERAERIAFAKAAQRVLARDDSKFPEFERRRRARSQPGT